jgi:phosphoribosylformylglycinamidine (FGAM) synthase-like enzyme
VTTPWSKRDADWGHLGQSIWLREIHGRADGAAPAVDLIKERIAGELIRRLISVGLLTAVHDVADGGVLVAITEMALASDIGAGVSYDPDHAEFHLFGEEQGRFVITTSQPDALRANLEESGLIFWYCGETAGRSLRSALDSDHADLEWEIPLADLRAANEGFFPRLMGADAALA